MFFWNKNLAYFKINFYVFESHLNIHSDPAVVLYTLKYLFTTY